MSSSRLTTATRLCFASSGSAEGLIANGLAFFQLLFYSQVCGLDPALAGLALLIALGVDAISDPLIGKWSDHHISKHGRRHPFIFSAILPVVLFYYLVWVPPSLDQSGLFFYLLCVSIGLRISLTAFSVPFASLIPDIASEYDERTRLINYSTSFAWLAGTTMAVTMYSVWLADTTEYPDGAGVLRAEGYADAGLVTAILIAGGMTAAALGTRKHIPSLHTPVAEERPGISDMVRQLWEAFSNPSFRALAVSAVFNAAGSGTATALWVYMQPYFWGFDSEQTSILLASQLFSAILAFICLPSLATGREKKSLFVRLSWVLVIVSTAPIALRLLTLFPDNGTELLFYTMLMQGIVQVMLVICVSILASSMLSDLVEVRQIETGRREEGSLFAIQSFIGKVATGIGTFFGGSILALINFPSQATSIVVSAETVRNLGLIYGPMLAVLYIAAIIAIGFYAIDRARHEENLITLNRQPNS